MGKELLKQTLHEIGRDAIPTEWDQWAQIKARAEQDSRALPPKLVKRPSIQISRRVVLVALILMLTTTAVYAWVQVSAPSNQDAGLIGVSNAGYITQLGLSQTSNNVQVDLNWGYIDEGRAVLHYQIYLINADGTRQPSPSDASFSARLGERNGYILNTVPNRYNFSSTIEPVELTFPITAVGDLPSNVDLRFELVFLEAPRIRGWLERFFSGNTSGVFYGIPIDAQATMPQGVADFTFDFTLPILRATNLTPMETVSAAGFDITLEYVNISPSQTEIRFCYPQNSEHYWWSQDSQLTLDGEVARARSTEALTQEDGRYCNTVLFELYAHENETLIITIPALERMPETPEEFRAAHDGFLEYGFDMQTTFNEDGTIGGFHWFSGVEPAQAAMVELGYRIEGNWVFTVEIPANAD